MNPRSASSTITTEMPVAYITQRRSLQAIPAALVAVVLWQYPPLSSTLSWEVVVEVAQVEEGVVVS